MMEWQPIETAPRDGTEIILYYGDWCGDEWLVISGTWDRAPGADYWMPLPKPPAEPAEWRDDPNHPGYEINWRTLLGRRKATHPAEPAPPPEHDGE